MSIFFDPSFKERGELLDLADPPERELPHLCGQGIAMGSIGLASHQLIGVNLARRMAAALIIVADEYERITS